ncbi:MAG: SMP-30/gluconolactonase/LRE family protein [Dehalococcoidia bacterium]
MLSWEFELAAGPFTSPTDGPVWDGEALLFTQIAPAGNAANNRILRYEPQGRGVTDYRRWTNRTYGLAFGPDGLLYGAQAAGRRIVRFNADGSASALAHKLDGIYHNQPKDLVVDRRSRIWFCDPHGELRSAMNPQIHDKLDHASVLRLEVPNPDSPIIRMTYDTDAPASVLLSQDEGTLYVAESSDEPEDRRELRAYAILENDALGPYRLLHTFGADHTGVHRGISGMCLDQNGNVVACAGTQGVGPGPMVYVFTPQGQVLESHPLPSEPTNCAFGGPELSTLYVTTSQGELYRCENTGRQGWILYPSSNGVGEHQA